jgi:hypothetical protein
MTTQGYDSLKARALAILGAEKRSDELVNGIKTEISRRVSEIGPIPVTASLTDLAALIAKVQSAKDYVSEQLSEAHYSNILHNKICEMMIDAAAAETVQSSADKRKGEAAMISSEFTLLGAQSDSFYRFCLDKLNALDSKHESLSRMVTCMQLLMNNFGGQHRFGALADGAGNIGRSGKMESLFSDGGPKVFGLPEGQSGEMPDF